MELVVVVLLSFTMPGMKKDAGDTLGDAEMPPQPVNKNITGHNKAADSSFTKNLIIAFCLCCSMDMFIHTLTSRTGITRIISLLYGMFG